MHFFLWPLVLNSTNCKFIRCTIDVTFVKFIWCWIFFRHRIYIQHAPTVGVVFSTVRINDAIKFSILLTDLWARLVRITTVSHHCKHESCRVALMACLAARLLINRHIWCRTTCKRPVRIPRTARVPAPPNLQTSHQLHSGHSSVRLWLDCLVVWQHFQGFCWLSC